VSSWSSASTPSTGLSLLRPAATFYAWVNVSRTGDLNSWDLATQLLEKHNLATIPGSAFGPAGEGYLRLTFAISDETINTACDRLEAFAASR
jgi:aminotransferase